MQHGMSLATALAVLVGGFVAARGAGDTLAAPPPVQGGDFEAPFTTVADIAHQWTAWGIDTRQMISGMTRDETDPHGGKACLRVFRPADPREWRGVVVNSPFKNALQPEPYTHYTLSFHARADRPGPIRVAVASYRSVKPIEQGPQIATHDFEVGSGWTECQLSFTAGEDFYADEARHIYVAFFPAVGAAALAQDKTLWLDDIAITATPLGDDVSRIVNPATLPVPALPLRLEPGPTLDLQIDAKAIVRPTNRLANGVAIAGLARWNGPFTATGAYALPQAAETAVRDLRIPFSRLYGLADDEPFDSIEAAIDKAAELLDRLDIPRDTTALELEGVLANTRLSPAEWRRAVAHARSKGLGFRHWEIGNEVYVSIWGAGGKAFASPTDYADHVIAVSRSIKEVQPEARVGISTKPDHIAWGNRLLAETAGHYDFVCPHFYDFSKVHQADFEDVVIAANHARLDESLRLKALLRAYNPNRQVSIYDTEWGLHSSAADGGKAWTEPRNANILGTLHRAVRMLYYAREDVVEGAAGWNLFSMSHNPGFLLVASDKPERRSMLFWLYHHFSRHLGDKVVAISGRCPYHPDPRDVAAAGYPLTPVLATLSDDSSRLFVMVVNGSWEQSVPARLRLAGFTPQACTAVVLRHDDLNAHPLLTHDEDFVGTIPVTITGDTLTLTLPAHSITFLTLTN